MRSADGFRWGAVVAVLAIVASKAYTSGKEHGAREWRAIALKQRAALHDWERQSQQALDAAEGWQREYCALAELVADNGLVPGGELPGCCPDPSAAGEDLAADGGERP